MAYTNQTRALAIQLLCAGIPQNRIAKIIGCKSSTVSKWYTLYRGYRGNEGVTITLKSKINNLTPLDV